MTVLVIILFLSAFLLYGLSSRVASRSGLPSRGVLHSYKRSHRLTSLTQPPVSVTVLVFGVLLSALAFLLYGVTPRSAVAEFVRQVKATPQVADLFRFLFLGTIVETGRKLGETLRNVGWTLFVVTAEFGTRDFAYDWVLSYLEHQHVWNESRSFKVVARNASSRPDASSALGKIDGHPDPIYEPAPLIPSFFQWRGYWISVNKTATGYSSYDTGDEVGGTLSIRIWTWKRGILDEFVRDARKYYIDSKVLPRNVEREKEPSGALMTARFPQGDLSHDWILAYLRSSDSLQDAMDLTISTKQSDLGWGTGPKDQVRYLPSQDTKQRFLFTSPSTGRSAWVQVMVTPSHLRSNSHIPTGAITLTIHSSDKEVLADLIDTARKTHAERGLSTVTVHLPDDRGEWAKTVTKSRRETSTLILPGDVKNTLLSDARAFLDCETWYSGVGIPYRRGYLLHGEPGTGKSSTVHALAGELGLEIYFISLASPGLNDYTLAKLLSDTPWRCVVLLEDIDCGFPFSRGEPQKCEEPALDGDATGHHIPPRSMVTLSGLLNVLDSVLSEEGRLIFATTNNIELLDPALLRAGRMDVKIHYKLADSIQIRQIFERFFPTSSGDVDNDSSAEVDGYASEFATSVPAGTYSMAQLQAYLLTHKDDPAAAASGVREWLRSQEEESRGMGELKQKKQIEKDASRT
ncbi:P-loop containing nucleoside triphosphate hydrolase protein [Mycena polygramma]|nr:P-loop containing nucleoside triphosphate hydrolase protein [Mycena polygramma]